MNGNERQHALQDFLSEAAALLARSEECLNHLELIRNDQDALNGILNTLFKLKDQAGSLGIEPITDFCLHLHRLLSRAISQANLCDETLAVLRECFTLLAWQLELIDLRTGQLNLDDHEQNALIATLAARTDQSEPPFLEIVQDDQWAGLLEQHRP